MISILEYLQNKRDHPKVVEGGLNLGLDPFPILRVCLDQRSHNVREGMVAVVVSEGECLIK